MRLGNWTPLHGWIAAQEEKSKSDGPEIKRLSTTEAARVLLEIGMAGRAQRIVGKLKAAGYEICKTGGEG